MTKPTTLTSEQLLEALSVLTEAGFTTILDKDPVKLKKIAKSKNGGTYKMTFAAALALTAKYKALEVAAANANEAVENEKERIQLQMGDATELMVDGVSKPIATFRWGAKTNFDKESAKVENPEFVAKHTTTDPEGTRSFRFPGVHVS